MIAALFAFGQTGVWWALIIVLFLLAYAGLIFPSVPDVPFLFGGFLVYQFLINSKQLGVVFWSVTIVATITLFLVDYFAGGYAAKKAGGSKWTMSAAALGVILFFWFPPVGFLIGPIITVFIVEFLFMRKPPVDALKIAVSTLIGFLGGVIVKFVLMSAMIVWFLLLVFVI